MPAPLNLDRSFFIVWTGDEFHACADRKDAELTARSCLLDGVFVIECNPIEGWSRNVTADFLDDEEDDEDREDREYRAQRAWERAMRPVTL